MNIENIIDWQIADRELRQFAKSRARSDFEEAGLLLAAHRARVHAELGLGDFFEYIDRVLGYGYRKASEKLRVAEEIEVLTAIGDALRDGVLNWSAVREITRVAVEETQREWIEAARGRRIREIEAMVSGRRRGDRPSDPSCEDAKKHVLRFEVSAETMATVREAIGRIKRGSDGAIASDDDVLLLMARAALGGPRDEARSSYQVAISVCPDCKRGVQEGRGRSIPIDEHVMEMIDCDAQWVSVDEHEHEHQHEHHERATQTVPPAKRRHVIRRDHHRCAVPGCTSAIFLDVHHTELVSEGGAHDTDRMITLCVAHHRAVHLGRLLITGRYSTGFVFRHADGSSYGAQLSVDDAKTFADAFSALKWLGFKEGESRAALDALRTHVGMTTERAIREALALLRPQV